MEVPKTVPGDPELQLPSMSVSMAQPVSVTLVPILLLPQKLAPFSHHQTLQHNLQQVMKTVFFLGMLAHYLRKLFLCKS